MSICSKDIPCFFQSCKKRKSDVKICSHGLEKISKFELVNVKYYLSFRLKVIYRGNIWNSPTKIHKVIFFSEDVVFDEIEPGGIPAAAPATPAAPFLTNLGTDFSGSILDSTQRKLFRKAFVSCFFHYSLSFQP